MPTRKTPTSMTDYLKSLREVKEVFQFIQTEIMDAQSRTEIKKMFIFGFLVIIFQAFVPLALGKIISGVSAKSIHIFIVGVVGTTGCMLVQKLFERQMSK